MRRTLVTILTLLTISLRATAQEAPVQKPPLPFDIFIDQKIGLAQIENWETDGFETKYAFADAGATFKLAYILLPASENVVAYDSEAIYILLGRLINRIVGNTASIDQINRYAKADVVGLTNGDFGISSFITNELPEANHHYKYDHVSVFYKRGYGIVFQLITAKKLEFFKSQTFIDALKSFKYPGIKSK